MLTARGVAFAVVRGVKNKTNQDRAKQPGRPMRVLIVEDSAKMRKNLRDVFSLFPRLKVVGMAKDGFEALEAVHILKPDVITLDIHMPRLNGLEVLSRIPKSKCLVIVLTALVDEFYRKKCRALRTDYFFDKITEFDRFLELVKTL